MNVYGFEVTKDMQAAGLAVMKQSFTAKDIVAALRNAGVPEIIGEGFRSEYCAHRAADRLIQKERKAGRIRANGRKWIPVAVTA